MARNIVGKISNVRNVRLPKLPDLDTSTPDVFEEMTLQEHLEELRDRIIKAIFAIVPAFIFGFIVQGRVLHDIKQKANAIDGLQNIAPTDSFTISFKIALYIALAITMPVIVYQFTAFLMPGMTKKEKRFFFSSLPFVSILFVLGCLFGYFIAAPRALMFLSNWNADSIAWQPTANETVAFFLTLMVGLGAAFQLPVIMFIFAKLGIVTPKKLRAWRRYAFMILLVIAAIITPTPDPYNMSIVALPLIILYEVGIWISAVFAKTTIGGANNEDTKETTVAKEVKTAKTTAVESVDDV